MVRLFAITVLELAANAVGLLVAAWLLPDFRMDAFGLAIVVGLFTIAKFILGPLMFKLSFKYVRALSGGVALVTTFVGLLVTSLLTDHLTISGFSTWVLSTLIVWLSGVIAAIVLPLFLFKKALANPNSRRAVPPLG